MRMMDRPKHPSGRPIRCEQTKPRPVWRVPDSGLVIPKLRPPENKTYAIGFRADLTAEDED